MEQEYFFSGYCRQIDGSRTVAVETEEGAVTADCLFPDCPYAQMCSIGIEIHKLTQEA